MLVPTLGGMRWLALALLLLSACGGVDFTTAESIESWEYIPGDRSAPGRLQVNYDMGGEADSCEQVFRFSCEAVVDEGSQTIVFTPNAELVSEGLTEIEQLSADYTCELETVLRPVVGCSARVDPGVWTVTADGITEELDVR